MFKIGDLRADDTWIKEIIQFKGWNRSANKLYSMRFFSGRIINCDYSTKAFDNGSAQWYDITTGDFVDTAQVSNLPSSRDGSFFVGNIMYRKVLQTNGSPSGYLGFELYNNKRDGQNQTLLNRVYEDMYAFNVGVTNEYDFFNYVPHPVVGNIFRVGQRKAISGMTGIMDIGFLGYIITPGK